MDFSSHLDPIYSQWLNLEALEGSLRANRPLYDCGNCKMGQQGVYSPELKCCTYLPKIPNYQVGRILEENKRITLRPKNMVLHPLGWIPDWHYQQNFLFKSGTDFGWKKELQCSFYYQGRCEIWKYRNSHCRSFHCDTLANNGGSGFWQELENLIFVLEQSISQNLLLEMGFEPQLYEKCLDTYSAKGVSLEIWTQMMDELSRSLDAKKLYLSTWDAYQKLSREDVSAFLDEEVLNKYRPWLNV